MNTGIRLGKLCEDFQFYLMQLLIALRFYATNSFQVKLCHLIPKLIFYKVYFNIL